MMELNHPDAILMRDRRFPRASAWGDVRELNSRFRGHIPTCFRNTYTAMVHRAGIEPARLHFVRVAPSQLGHLCRVHVEGFEPPSTRLKV